MSSKKERGWGLKGKTSPSKNARRLVLRSSAALPPHPSPEGTVSSHRGVLGPCSWPSSDQDQCLNGGEQRARARLSWDFP